MRRSRHALTTGFVLLALVSGLPGLLSAGCAKAASAGRAPGCDHERPVDGGMLCCAAPQVAPTEGRCCSVSEPGPAPAPGVPGPAPPTTVPDAAAPAPAIAPAPAHTPFAGVAPAAGPPRPPPVPLFTLHAALLI